jgi:hypothetical protein
MSDRYRKGRERGCIKERESLKERQIRVLKKERQREKEEDER